MYRDIYSMILPFLSEKDSYKFINGFDDDILMKDLNFRVAASHGCLKIMKFLLKNNEIHDKILSESFDLASKGGHLEVITWFDDIHVIGSQLALKWACKNNHLNVVKYLCSIGITPMLYDLEYAVFNGNLELLKYLVSITKQCPSGLAHCATIQGRLDIIIFLYSQNVNFNDYPANYVSLACEHGHLDIVIFFYSINITIQEQSMIVAAKNNHLHVVKYLCSIGIHPSNWTFHITRLYNNTDILQWFEENSYLELPYE